MDIRELRMVGDGKTSGGTEREGRLVRPETWVGNGDVAGGAIGLERLQSTTPSAVDRTTSGQHYPGGHSSRLTRAARLRIGNGHLFRQQDRVGNLAQRAVSRQGLRMQAAKGFLITHIIPIH